MADDVQADFYDLMWARSLIADMKTLKKTHSSIRAVGASAQNLKAKLETTEAEARANLEAAGVDIAALIAEAEAYDEQLAVHNATLVDAGDHAEKRGQKHHRGHHRKRRLGHTDEGPELLQRDARQDGGQRFPPDTR